MSARGRAAIVATIAMLSCREAPPPAEAEPDSAPVAPSVAVVSLVDTAVPPAAIGDARWQFQQTASADLNGDGSAERIVLIANVELVRGRPAWDDGQRWQLYVESTDGKRTRIYARFVQLGHVEAFLGAPSADGARPIVIVERTPHRLALWEARYRGPNDVAARELAAPEIDPSTSLTGTTR